MPKPISEFLDKIICGDTLEVLKQMPSDSVDCIITSPPYWGLRDYGEATCKVWGGDPDCEHEFELEHIQREPSKTGEISEKAKIGQGYRNYKSGFCKKCGAWYGQLGLEPTPELYVEHLGLILKEIYRVLKPTGTFWLNIGDTYSGTAYDLPRKCMLCIPERVLFKCLEIGFIVRNKIVWYKPNHLPSSVKDRLANAWEYIYLLVKKPKGYYFNLDAIRESIVTDPSKITSNSLVREAKKEKYDKQGRLVKHDIAVGRIGNFSYSDPLHTRPYYGMSKFLESDVQTASPAQRALKVLLSGKLTTKVRKAIEGLANYLKRKKEESGYTIKELSELTGIKKTTLEHYFRTDECFTIPDKSVWEALKPLLNLGEYEDFVTEEIRNALPSPHPLGKNPGDVWSLTTEPFPEAHFAVFPVKLVVRCLAAGSPPDGVVLDPFIGSGTVGLACELLNHKMWDKIPKFEEIVNAEIVKSMDWKLRWIGVDIVSEYIDMAKRRIEKEVFSKAKTLDMFVRM